MTRTMLASAPGATVEHGVATLLQRKCACGASAGLSGECAECGRKKILGIQTKLAISEPGDPYEEEADRVADQVMAASAHSALSGAPPRIQRFSAQPAGQGDTAPASVDQALASPGRPLESALRDDMEQRFGHDFSRVRVHTGAAAEQSARGVSANAYTVGHQIVFGAGRYAPGMQAGRRLIAHELTHVVQQGAAPRIQHRSVNENGEQHVQSSVLDIGMANHLVQRFPGDGMVPPGDCSWATYLVLRGSVETAKAVVSTLGACNPGDSCLFLATKIAAITAEIAARLALDTTCFKGGDAGHRAQVQEKINMMNRCYRFFNALNCPPALIAAMAVVVEKAREVIAAAAVVVAVALVVALIAAIIALAKVIAAALAAAAEGAAVAAAAAAVIALLVLVRDELSSGESPSA